MENKLKKTLTACIQAANMIKASAKNSRIFTAMCEEMGSDRVNLLYYTEAPQLSQATMCKNSYIQIFH
jgi:hypothetical protein